MNDYQKHLLNLPDYLFDGEDESTLLKMLKGLGSLSNKNIDAPMKPPLGNIVVAKEDKDAWISERKSFYGWNVNLLSISKTDVKDKNNSTLIKILKTALSKGYYFGIIHKNPNLIEEKEYALQGYSPSYDIKADFGNQCPHDLHNIIYELIFSILGEAKAKHTPLMDATHDEYWGTTYEIWENDNIYLKNYLYGHPRDGFFTYALYIKTK